MKQKSLILIIIGFVTLSCTVPKSARELKRTTADWRKPEKVLWGYSDSPQGSTKLILRENNKFELTSSGFFMVWFEAGSWTVEQDTIKLSFVDKDQKVNKTERVYLDKQESKIYFQAADKTGLKLRVLLNKLHK